MRALTALTLGLLLLPVGCKNVRVASGSDDKFIHTPRELNAPPPPLEKTLFPTTIGSKWVYRLAEGETGQETIMVTGTRQIDGTKAIVLSSKRVGQPDREELYEITEEQIKQLSAGGQDKVTLKPPMPLIQAPLAFDAVVSWQGGVAMRGSLVPSTSKSRLRSVEQVVVPAGTYTTYRVDTNLEAQLKEGPARFWTTRWFAPGIGPVKIRYIVSAPGQPDHAFMKELVSCDIKPLPVLPARGLYELR
ncbi:hypothetical protein [Armatimonas rosea]|uniref:Uncharacterized protein n=1 Tax=Armatimonas rosea TaxID=685828 RepID=A0A7W9SXD5_ARMRO|nr:hypothetical protein [Armatimonas rosea]MBB6053979.1 hypothetical protein [Armatimonas rosea]